MAEILLIDNILAMNLSIPNYQRPYKWQEKNVLELLFDLKAAIDTSNKAGYEDFRYRLGTILLHKTGDRTFDIVDWQQRLLTLSLLKLVLNKSYSNSLLKYNFADPSSTKNLILVIIDGQAWISSRKIIDCPLIKGTGESKAKRSTISFGS